MNHTYNEKNAAATAAEICSTLVYKTELRAVIAAAEKRLAQMEAPACTDDGQLLPDFED
ncbi:MAG: hypothetical protein RTU92_08630 [Candidatus Thorarchaeota archaeon]